MGNWKKTQKCRNYMNLCLQYLPQIHQYKTFVGNSTRQGKIPQIKLLSIEKKRIQNMSEHPCFYNDVIDELTKIDRRIELHFKQVSFQKMLP